MDSRIPRSPSSSMKVSLITTTNRPFASRRRYRLFNSTIHELESAGSANDSYRFILMAILTSTMMLAEIVTGIVTGSLTLLSDALHMMSDLIALIIGFIAHRMANGQATEQNSFEHTMVYMRYEIVGALINGTILLTSCFIMALEAVQRIAFFNEEIENVDFVLIVGGLGLFINLVGLCIFGHHGHSHSHSHPHPNDKNTNVQIDIEIDEEKHQHQHEHEHAHAQSQSQSQSQSHKEENLNIRGVFLHILGDLLGSVAVMVSALIIKFTDGWWTTYIDPVCTLLIVMLISRTAWPLVRQSANILLDKSPFNSSVISEIETELCSISGVLNVHELHCWEVKTGYYMATVHLIIDPNWMDDDHTVKYCNDECDILHDKMTIIDQAKAILHKYGIHSSIVQSEFPKQGDMNRWKSSIDPCFDYVCNTSDCMKKSKALSNSMANLKKSISKKSDSYLQKSISKKTDSYLQTSQTDNNVHNGNGDDNDNDNDNNSNDAKQEIQLTQENEKINV